MRVQLQGRSRVVESDPVHVLGSEPAVYGYKYDETVYLFAWVPVDDCNVYCSPDGLPRLRTWLSCVEMASIKIDVDPHDQAVVGRGMRELTTSEE